MQPTLGITDQVRLAFQQQHRIPAIVGAVLGSLPPLAAFAFSHFGLDLSTWQGRTAVVFVLACLAFSAPKVYRWSAQAFSSRIEALGFAVLLEGAMTLADHRTPVLAVVSYACLATLVGINAVVTAVAVALSQKAVRAAQREQAASNPDTLSLAPVVPLGLTRTQLQTGPVPGAPRRTAKRKAGAR